MDKTNPTVHFENKALPSHHGLWTKRFVPSALNVNVKRFTQARVNSGRINKSLIVDNLSLRD